MPFRRKYFCARMSTATWDQVSGTSTSLASKTTLPSSLVMRLVRGTKVMPLRGSCPARVKWRAIFMAGALVQEVGAGCEEMLRLDMGRGGHRPNEAKKPPTQKVGRFSASSRDSVGQKGSPQDVGVSRG